MRYAIFSDIHANLEALEAVLAKIDEIGQEKPIDQIWFLGDLVGYGPNPNECIIKLRERTDVIIAGNHDWAAVGKIDLEDFSAAARISAEWTAKELTEEHRTFLTNLPERIEIGECTLVHGSPYGPLWEYLTSEVLAERSFQYFSSRFCFVGHTHVPVIFQQPDSVANAPTTPLDEDQKLELANIETTLLNGTAQNGTNHLEEADEEPLPLEEVDEDDTQELLVVLPKVLATKSEKEQTESVFIEPPVQEQEELPDEVDQDEDELSESEETGVPKDSTSIENEFVVIEDVTPSTIAMQTALAETPRELIDEEEQKRIEEALNALERELDEEEQAGRDTQPQEEAVSPEAIVLTAEERLNSEIEELLTLLGLSQAMVPITNEMFAPPEGHWGIPEGCRFIINAGGVGQPRDGDPRAAFMIYDSEQGFDFYRIPYPFEKTQEKIIQAGLPQYLAVRLAYGR